MQDNSKIYTARDVKDWFLLNGIPLQEHPPCSPDLNPIKHIWALLKQRLNERHSKLEFMGESKADKATFKAAIEKEWWDIEQSVIDDLIASMPARIDAVLASEGWYTDY